MQDDEWRFASQLMAATLRLAAAEITDVTPVDYTAEERMRENAKVILDFHNAAMAYAKQESVKDGRILRDTPCAKCGEQVTYDPDNNQVAVVTVMRLGERPDIYHYTCYTNQFRR